MITSKIHDEILKMISIYILLIFNAINYIKYLQNDYAFDFNYNRK